MVNIKIVNFRNLTFDEVISIAREIMKEIRESGKERIEKEYEIRGHNFVVVVLKEGDDYTIKYKEKKNE